MHVRSDLYPVLIFSTRYGGTYEGGPWAAMAKRTKVPKAAVADDCTCAAWWDIKGKKIGLGATPLEAYEDLCVKRPEPTMELDLIDEAGDVWESMSVPMVEWRKYKMAAHVTGQTVEDWFVHAIKRGVELLMERYEAELLVARQEGEDAARTTGSGVV